MGAARSPLGVTFCFCKKSPKTDQEALAFWISGGGCFVSALNDRLTIGSFERTNSSMSIGLFFSPPSELSGFWFVGLIGSAKI